MMRVLGLNDHFTVYGATTFAVFGAREVGFVVCMVSSVRKRLREFRSIVSRVGLRPRSALCVLKSIVSESPSNVEVLQGLVGVPGMGVLLKGRRCVVVGTLICPPGSEVSG